METPINHSFVHRFDALIPLIPPLNRDVRERIRKAVRSRLWLPSGLEGGPIGGIAPRRMRKIKPPRRRSGWRFPPD
jgi:hypothetical protein